MADATALGYLISVDAVTIVNHTTLRAISVVQNTAIVQLKNFTTPTGVVIDYDATSDSQLMPSRMTQEFLCTTGGIALYATLIGKQGNYVTSILSPLTGTDIKNLSTRLLSVDDITPQKVKRDGDVHIRVTISITGDWVNV